MKISNWWKRWKKGDAVCKVASPDSLNRVYNVLEDIDVMGLNGIDATINKPTCAEGKGWTITIDAWPITKYGAYNKRLPFDIVKRANDYAVWVGALGTNAIEVCNAYSCDPVAGTVGNDGYASVGNSDDNEVWLWVGVDSTGAYYQWGIDTAYPDNQSIRFVARWQIGEISDGRIKQFWRGRIRISDNEFDDLSIERQPDIKNLIQLYKFSEGTTNNDTLSNVDLLYRIDTSVTSTPEYRLRYMAGSYLHSLIEDIVNQKISELWSEITDPSSPEFGALRDRFSSIFQPLVIASTTTDNLGSTKYCGIEMNALGQTWTPATP